MGKFDNIKVNFYFASDTFNEEDEEVDEFKKGIFFLEPAEMTLGLS